MSMWSDKYKKHTEEAIALAQELGATNRARISPYRNVSNGEIIAARDAVSGGFYQLLRRRIPEWWGVCCQDLATMIFVHLANEGFEVDIVVGGVDIQGNNEYDATVEGLISEYMNPDFCRQQNIHAWVSLGGDVVIDAGLSARLVKYYRMPEDIDPGIVVERADWISNGWHSRHIPMFVGTDFIAKTNSHDPLSILNKFKLR